MHSLTEPELGIMQALWEAGKEVPRMYIQNRLSHLNWTASTFNTYLNRLQAKRFLAGELKGQTSYYRPVITMESYQANESSSILARLFGGSLKSFLLSLSDTDTIDSDALEDIQTFLDQMKNRA